MAFAADSESRFVTSAPPRMDLLTVGSCDDQSCESVVDMPGVPANRITSKL